MRNSYAILPTSFLLCFLLKAQMCLLPVVWRTWRPSVGSWGNCFLQLSGKESAFLILWLPFCHGVKAKSVEFDLHYTVSKCRAPKRKHHTLCFESAFIVLSFRSVLLRPLGETPKDLWFDLRYSVLKCPRPKKISIVCDSETHSLFYYSVQFWAVTVKQR